MASGPITSWEIDGETVADFIFGGSNITADGEFSHEIKRRILIGRQRIKRQRHYFVNNGPSSQVYGFPVVMYGCEIWTIKKAECQITDAFELWC